MADFGTPAAANYTAPDGLATLGNLMSIKQKQQGLQAQQLSMQGQQYQNQSMAANAQVSTQDAKEKMQGAQLLADPVGNGLTSEDGTPTKDARAKIMAAMPTTGGEHYQSLLSAAQGHVVYKNSALKLSTDVRDTVSSQLAGTAADPKNGLPEMHRALENTKQTYAGTPAADDVNKMVAVAQQAMNDAAKVHGVQGAKQAVMGLSRGGLGNAGITGAGGVASGTPSTVDNGPNIQPGVQAPALEGGGFSPSGPPIRKDLAPTQTPSYIRATSAAGTEGGHGAANDEDLYNQITATGTKSAQVKSLTQDISKLADEVKTGSYSKALANKWTTISQMFGVSPADDSPTTRRQLLGKYTQQLMLQQEQANGASTDAAKQHVESAMPDPEHMDPEAIKSAAKYVGGQADIAATRAQVANSHRSANGGISTGLRSVDSHLMSNADPRIFVYKDIPKGPERQAYLRDHFKTSEEVQDFLAKQAALNYHGGK